MNETYQPPDEVRIGGQEDSSGFQGLPSGDELGEV